MTAFDERIVAVAGRREDSTSRPTRPPGAAEFNCPRKSIRATKKLLMCLLSVVLWTGAPVRAQSTQPLEGLPTPRPVVTTPRLYVLDCGEIPNYRTEEFGLKRSEVKYPDFAVMCFLLVHPKGVLLFDAGLPDELIGRPLYETYRRGWGQIVLHTLRGQLADIGYTPNMIDYLLLSHSHFDHVGNVRYFLKSTWLVQKTEWDYMFGLTNGKPYEDVEDFDGMKSMKTIFLPEGYDVFGDGVAVVKRTYGHTPGHNVLAINLRDTGRIVLAGDLWHYPEERSLHRIGPGDDNPANRKAREDIDAWAARNNAQVWLAHDMSLFQRLVKAPGFYQ
jgi:N-acyl homoserine lactone hydrolase